MATSSNKKKIQQKEFQDAHGISRKEQSNQFSPNLFIAIKIALVVLIPIVYFVYSPALIFLMILYACLFFVARLAENSLNKSVIRSNHIKLPKFDSAIALLVVVVAICGTFVSATKNTKSGTFDNFDTTKIESFMNNKDFDVSEIKKQATIQKIKTYAVNMGSLLTGERNVFSKLFSNDKNGGSFKFGTGKPPSDFISNKEALDSMLNSGNFTPSERPEGEMQNGEFPSKGERPNFGGRGGFGNKNNFNFSMDNIPIEYTFSSALSAVTTVLTFSVPAVGFGSVLYSILKRKKFNKDMVEVIVEDKIELLNDSELDRILSFGEEVEETKISANEINKKIKLEHQTTTTIEQSQQVVEEEIIEENEIGDDFGF